MTNAEIENGGERLFLVGFKLCVSPSKFYRQLTFVRDIRVR